MTVSPLAARLPPFRLKVLGIALLLILGTSLAAAQVKATSISPRAVPAAKAILVLFPYQVDLASTELAVAAFREEFGAATDLNCELFFEFLDLNRFSSPTQLESCLELLKARYRDRRIDLVIVQSPRILSLWLEHRAGILPAVPVVFFDTTAENLGGQRLPSDVRGVYGVYDFSRSVSWLLEVRPSTSEIVLVHGMGAADQRSMAYVEALRRDFEGRVRLTDVSSLPMAEIKGRLASLPRSSAVLYFLMFEDASGVKHRPIEALRELASASAVPILTGFEQFVGVGTIGGYMYSIAGQAQSAARLGLRILRGEKPESIGIEEEGGNRFIFDHLALRRFGLPLSLLPPGSVVKNRQYSAWELYRFQLVAAGLVFVLLASLVILLIIATRRLQAARGALRRSNSELEEQVRERTAALEKSLGENRGLLGELQHRAKNSFGMISGLIGLSAGNDASEETRRTIEELEQRVRSVSDLYSLLYSSGSFAELRLDEYCARLVSGMASLSGSARLRTDFDAVTVPAKVAAPIGLILTELLTNALKYGLPEGRPGTITISLKAGPHGSSLQVRDEGAGLPADFDPARTSGKGLALVRALADQIHGSFVIEGSPSGTRCELLFSAEGSRSG